jgi:hypothetical protein
MCRETLKKIMETMELGMARNYVYNLYIDGLISQREFLEMNTDIDKRYNVDRERER